MLPRLLIYCALLTLTVAQSSLAQLETPEFRAPLASAQEGWVYEYALPGVGEDVHALASDGDKLYVGGSFRVAGSELSHGVAVYSSEDQTWSALAETLNPGGVVRALAVGLDGSLYAGGSFTTINGIEVNGIARHDAELETWFPLEGGVDGTVGALAVGEDGTVYVGGAFSMAGGESAGNIAAWDGNSWNSLGNLNGQVRALYVSNNNLYVGGSFGQVDGQASPNIAAVDLDNGEWSAVGGGIYGSVLGVESIIETNGFIYVGGSFEGGIQGDGDNIVSHNAIRWDIDLGKWFHAGVDPNLWINTLAFDSEGTVYAGAAQTSDGFLRRMGEEWEVVGFADLPLAYLRFPTQIIPFVDSFVIGFSAYVLPDGSPTVSQFIYTYDPAVEAWSVLAGSEGGGVDHLTGALASDGEGGVYVGGNFAFAGSAAANHVAHLSPGGSWAPLGGGVDGLVHALLSDADGTAYVGGHFGSALQASGDALDAKHVAAWDPHEAEWRPLGLGVVREAPGSTVVRALTTDLDGTVLVGGNFEAALQADGSVVSADRLARWRPDQEAWDVITGGHGLVSVNAIAVDVTGAIYAGGVADNAGIAMARLVRLLSGATEWETLRDWPVTQGSIMADLVVWGNPGGQWGGLYAAVFGEGTWYWDGTSWEAIGGSVRVRELALNGIPGEGGLLYAGAEPDQGGPSQVGPWQWDGVEWALTGGGVDRLASSSEARIFALHAVPHHDGTASLWVGGFFGLAGGQPSASLARWLTQDYGISTEGPPVEAGLLDLAVFPNPLGAIGTVEFALPVTAEVRLEIYDILGRRVQTLLDEQRPGGAQRLDFSTAGLASGAYVVRLTAGSQVRAVLVTRVE